MSIKSFMSNVEAEVSAKYDSTKAAIKGAGAEVSAKYDSAKAAIKNALTPKPPIAGRPDFLRGSNDKVFVHDTTKLAPSDEYSIEFLANILDKYDVHTYHWKLFICSLDDAANGNILSKSAQTIIAESGVTDLTIDNVELHGIAVPSAEAGTGTQTMIKFTVTEPSSAKLLDQMFYEATSLGIGNWLVMPTYLQLEFRGRDPATSEAIDSNEGGGLEGMRWVFPLKLTNAKANVTAAGTVYNFDAIMYDELGQTNSYFGIIHNVTLSGLTTFGNAMEDLADKLNADQYEKLLDNYSIPDTYRIVVEPKLAALQLVEPDDKKNTAWGRDLIDFDKKTAQYSAGTGIDKIVDSLLGNTSYFQKKMQSAKTPSAEPDTANEAESQMKSLWRIVTETHPIGYDLVRQNNAVEITIFIVEYDLGLADVKPTQTGQTPATANAAKGRFGEYVQKKIMKKVYNYLFTGLNDQIIDFDLNLNFSFAATLARFSGSYFDSATQQTGVSQQDQIEKDTDAVEAIRSALQLLNSASSEKDKAKEIATAHEKIKAAKLDPIQERRYTAILNNARPEARRAFAAKVKAAGGVENDLSLSTSRIQAKSLATPVGNSGLQFISDVDSRSDAALKAKALIDASRKGKLRPVPYIEGMNEGAFKYGIDPQSNAGRARVSNVFATALYSTLDASMQYIKLTIKGDPFWLFPGSIPAGATTLPLKSKMDKDAAIAAIKQSHITNANSANFNASDNFIVLRFRSPEQHNPDTDNVELSLVETFSGVYKVITVVSKFENGKFVQELSCTLDPMINLMEFLDEIERAHGKTASDIVDNSSDRLEAKKFQKNPIKLPPNVRGAGFNAADPRRLDTGKIGDSAKAALGSAKSTATSAYSKIQAVARTAPGGASSPSSLSGGGDSGYNGGI